MRKTNIFEGVCRRFSIRLLPTAFCLLLAAFCLLPAAYAQNATGVKGKVRNMRDEGIAGAAISARQNGVDLKTAKSDAKGNFILDGLDAGIYNLAFEARGYSAAVQYNVEIKKGKIRDLGSRLILIADRGSKVIVKGSVFFKGGNFVPGAKVEIERINADGSVKKIGETMCDALGEFSFTQPEGPAKLRIKATFRDGKGSKDLDVDSPMIYRLAIALDIERGEK